MATVYQRVRYFCKKQKTFLLSQQGRIEIGKLVAAAYRSQFGKVPEKRLRIEEPEGKFNVQWYPTEFIDQIDAIIKSYNANIGNVQPGSVKFVTVAPPKRKRIPRQPKKVNI